MSIVDLVGKPYQRNCYDGSAFDCWSLVWWIYKTEGIELPQSTLEFWQPRTIDKEIREQLPAWQEVAFRDRQYLDVLLMFTSQRFATHVGLTIDYKWFIHTRPETGVVLNRFDRGLFSPMIKQVYRWRP